MRKLLFIAILIFCPIVFAQTQQQPAQKNSPQYKKDLANQNKHKLIKHKQLPLVQQPEVKKFITKMVKEEKFSRPELIKLFKQVKIRQIILDKIEHPYEKVPWYEYKQHFLNQKRIQGGVAFWHKYATTLERAHRIYGVDPSIIVAIIGVESNYGKQTGKFRVIDALSTIGFNYPKRAEYFRKELAQFLLLCREKKLNPLKVYGSYAGAIGQPQFMPSNFRQYAVAFNASDEINLSTNTKDVIGSIAHFFQAHGWKRGHNIALRAKVKKPLRKTFPSEYKEPQFTLAQLSKFHIKPVTNPPPRALMNIIKLQEKNDNIYWLGFHNMRVITFYNTSIQYAMAAYQLSQEIKKAYYKSLKKPHDNLHNNLHKINNTKKGINKQK